MFNPKCNATFGGAEVDFYHQAVKLAEDSRYDVSFLVGDFGQDNIEYYENVKVIKHNYDNIEKNADNSSLVKILRYLDLFKKLLFIDADIFYTKCASELLGWMVLINKIIRRKKVIFRLASDVDADPNFYRNNGKRFYAIYNFGLLNADLVISQTASQRDELKKINIDSTIISNGFPIDLSKKILLENKKDILWVGRCVPLKRPELVLELARRLPEERFVLIMPSYEMEELNIYAQDIVNGISRLPNVRHIDYVAFKDMSLYYEKAKLFVNTSEYEGFPNTFIQACMEKTPLLSFKVNPDNFINVNKLGYVCDDSLEAAVNFVLNLDTEKLRFYGENAFEYVSKHHNIDEIIKQYDDEFGLKRTS